MLFAIVVKSEDLDLEDSNGENVAEHSNCGYGEKDVIELDCRVHGPGNAEDRVEDHGEEEDCGLSLSKAGKGIERGRRPSRLLVHRRVNQYWDSRLA